MDYWVVCVSQFATNTCLAVLPFLYWSSSLTSPFKVWGCTTVLVCKQVNKLHVNGLEENCNGIVE